MKTKQEKQTNALLKLEAKLASGKKVLKVDGKTTEHYTDLTIEDIEITKEQIQILKNRLEGIKKTKIKSKKEVEADKYKNKVIDIFTIKFGYVKKSERKKSKGKSRKGMKKVKTVTYLKSVPLKEGLFTAMKEGKAGISPKFHKFNIRDTSIQPYAI